MSTSNNFAIGCVAIGVLLVCISLFLYKNNKIEKKVFIGLGSTGAVLVVIGVIIIWLKNRSLGSTSSSEI